MDVSVIIVNFNTTQLTLNCVRSVFRYTLSNSFEVIIIDNASVDTSISSIQSQFPDVKILYNKRNLGFGRANNQGISISKGRYVFLLNSDTELLSDAIGTFWSFMEAASNKLVACCGANLVDESGKPQVSYGNFPSIAEGLSALGPLVFYRKYFARHLSAGVFNYSNEIRPVDYICGADMFIRTSVLQELGGFDEEFFLYFEEVELSRRFKKAGFSSVIIPVVSIVHHEGASQDKSIANVEKVKQFAKSRKLYFKKTSRIFTARIINKIYSLQALIFALSKWDRNYLKAALVLARI